MNDSNTPHQAIPKGIGSQPDSNQQRPLIHRLVHTVVEALLAFALAGGLLFGLTREMCRVKYRCDDLGGLPYALLSLAIGISAFCGYLFLCRKYRDRVSTRIDLDACVALFTVGLWAWIILVK